MLKTRIITAVILLVLLLGLLYANSYTAVVLACAAFFAAASWEVFRLFGSRQPLIGAALWAIAFLFEAWADRLTNSTAFYAVCCAIWVIRLGPSLVIGLPSQASISNRLLAAVYGLAIFGALFAILALFRHSAVYLFSVMALVWIADIGAFAAGKAYGRHKLAPSISPGKSWEGAIGGWVAVLLIAGLSTLIPQLGDTFAVHLQARFGWAGFVAVMTLMVVASVVGDLFESQLKRRAGFKDSSNLLPGHGGVLDRIDALIPALPLAVLVNHWL